MARQDLSVENGWILEQEGSPVLQTVAQTSAIEAFARRQVMNSLVAVIHSLDGANPRIVEEGAAYPEAALTLDDQELRLQKYGEILAVSREDIEDTNGAILDEYKKNWFRNWAVKFDNACLGVTADAGTDAATRAGAPFQSVYAVASDAGNVTPTAGALELELLSEALSAVEVGSYFNPSASIIIAHPSLRASLRVLKDAAGNPVYSQGQAVSGQVGDELYGHKIVYSLGARTSTAQSSAPTGNPLLIIGDRNYMVNGVGWGPGSKLSTEVDFKTDVHNLKVSARRAFKVTVPEAFQVVEITSA